MVPLVKFPMVPLGESRTHAVSLLSQWYHWLPLVKLPMVPLGNPEQSLGIVTGDFNLDMLCNHTSRKVFELCEQFSLYQTITEPTHYTENSSSLIDIILTSDKSNLIYSGVAEPFLQQDIRYHCPVYGVFKYTKHSKKSFTRRIWSYDRGDYDLLRTKVANTDWDSLSDPDVNIYASNITNHLNSLL